MVPLTFLNPVDYNIIDKGSELVFANIKTRVEQGERNTPVKAAGKSIAAVLGVSDRQRRILLEGSALSSVCKQLHASEGKVQ